MRALILAALATSLALGTPSLARAQSPPPDSDRSDAACQAVALSGLAEAQGGTVLDVVRGTPPPDTDRVARVAQLLGPAVSALAETFNPPPDQDFQCRS